MKSILLKIGHKFTENLTNVFIVLSKSPWKMLDCLVAEWAQAKVQNEEWG